MQILARHSKLEERDKRALQNLKHEDISTAGREALLKAAMQEQILKCMKILVGQLFRLVVYKVKVYADWI
jgi:hypothetical protein